jgi:hypothetical protein
MMTALEEQKLNRAVALFVEMEKVQAQMRQQHQELVKLLHELKFQSYEPNPKPKIVRIK